MGDLRKSQALVLQGHSELSLQYQKNYTVDPKSRLDRGIPDDKVDRTAFECKKQRAILWVDREDTVGLRGWH